MDQYETHRQYIVDLVEQVLASSGFPAHVTLSGDSDNGYTFHIGEWRGERMPERIIPDLTRLTGKRLTVNYFCASGCRVICPP
jgi:hypothetical protein